MYTSVYFSSLCPVCTISRHFLDATRIFWIDQTDLSLRLLAFMCATITGAISDKAANMGKAVRGANKVCDCQLPFNCLVFMMNTNRWKKAEHLLEVIRPVFNFIQVHYLTAGK